MFDLHSNNSFVGSADRQGKRIFKKRPQEAPRKTQERLSMKQFIFSWSRRKISEPGRNTGKSRLSPMNSTYRIPNPPWAIQIVTVCGIELGVLKSKKLTI